MRVLKLCRENLDAMLLEKGNALLGRTSYGRDCEDGSDGGTNEIGVVEVCQRIAHDNTRCLCCIGTAEDGSEIARLLYPLEDNKQGLTIDSPALLLQQRIERKRLRRTDNGYDALCAATVGYALVDVLRHLNELRVDS
jgi:hypothetical protein